MSSFYNSISSSLRSTEDVLVAVDALVVPNSSTNTPPSPEASENWHDRRVLAVVSHKDEWALAEEGALFVYKLSASTNSTVRELNVQNIYPIYGNFSIVMSQMRRNTLDLSVVSSKTVLDQPRSGFSLTVNPAKALVDGIEAPTFYATDVQSLSSLVTECKRLKETSEIDSQETIDISQSASHFNWLRPYIPRAAHPSILTSGPPDLRIVNKPLLQRLSPASAGLPGDDDADVQIIRDAWARDKARSLVRRGRRRISLRLGTFNVNGKMPSQDLSSWVQGTGTTATLPEDEALTAALPPTPPPKATPPRSPKNVTMPKNDDLGANASATPSLTPGSINEVHGPDILVLGFQELDLSAEALIYSTSTVREDAWCLAVFAALGEKAVHYEKLASKQLVGMLIVVLVKKTLKGCCGGVKVSSVGSGILGVMGNKGATAIRMTFTPPFQPDISTEDQYAAGALTLTFVNAHLAAFDEMVDKRNQEFHELSKRLEFGRDSEETETPNYDDDFGTQPGRPANISIYETDALFWMGDLNYRVDIPDSDFRTLLADEDWNDRLNTLVRYDQLKKSITSKMAFDGFFEDVITYLPTYRFSPNFGTDKLGYDRKRRPAWTDRILYVPGPDCNITQHSYTSYSQVTMSDHRPVAANFSVDFDLYEKSRYESAMQQLYREVQALDTTHERSIIKLDQSFLDFGEIRYCTHLTKKVVIENIGRIPCAWRFVPVQLDSPIYPEWLSIQPVTGMILSGEKIEIALTIQMDNRVAASLNLGPRDLSGTLILHTVLGKDHFIAISGEYLPSCFGNKLSTLIRLPGPIRSLASSKDLRPENHPLNAPREVMRLVNWLMGSDKPPKNLFLVSPDETTLDTIRECLDTGEEFPWSPGENAPAAEASHAFAYTLLRLLDSLIEPIIPALLHPRCVQMTSRDEAFELLDALQSAAVNVWVTVTAFLHFICQSSEDPQYASKIADIFTPVLMRDDLKESTAIPVSPVGKRRFFLYFIT
ncbi:DNase I-like protein [Macrolepiota fuliginosa MF-IS2]|uniref:DNase I-like protein n=1 Tax=Macrolepiota fuliginosa MF-IS2 TaxID=1400762 RepID=A0A9P5XKZ2_9AGAR|nr:DNase I-like protein [Macrolepiota fuliginosa MF-IS2]